MARMQGLKAELQRVETELEEAQAGHEEANEFGDDDLAAEFAAAERRLQVTCCRCQTRLQPLLMCQPSSAAFCRIIGAIARAYHEDCAGYMMTFKECVNLLQEHEVAAAFQHGQVAVSCIPHLGNC